MGSVLWLATRRAGLSTLAGLVSALSLSCRSGDEHRSVDEFRPLGRTSVDSYGNAVGASTTAQRVGT
ncbi:hypothetical protein EIL87_11350 [Saccharopolyspora rhizosphaerae]|uniref:Uncharacterized protein n=1 Tax=Saccharopolyspora rhizosphaerae TaxID=2492662 RepID=A0A3R8P0J8_9PSEU|nr:hypothetical protein [Saccharopolyspora rhizosphaerae]RRO16884.1 hypothetical protein EIL87_11350 [Saccharopolyspora rhizosphaerae]